MSNRTAVGEHLSWSSEPSPEKTRRRKVSRAAGSGPEPEVRPGRQL
jgi:hypothetical protein